MSGSNLLNQPGVYGTQGMASPNNVPRARAGGAGWTDAAGDLWLFGGGIGPLTSGYLNDLWRYSAGQWTWMGGSNVVDQSGVYGTQGIAALSNTPGAREPGAVWTDASGDFWLFGGWGHDSAGTVDGLDDLWKYSAGQWTWIGGSTLVRELAVFGTKELLPQTILLAHGPPQLFGLIRQGTFGSLAGLFFKRQTHPVLNTLMI